MLLQMTGGNLKFYLEYQLNSNAFTETDLEGVSSFLLNAV